VSDQREHDERTRRWIYAALHLATERIPEWRRMTALLALPHLITDGRYLEAVELGRAMAGAWESEGLSHGADGRVVAMSFSVVPALLSVARHTADDRRAAAQQLLEALLNAAETDASGAAYRDIVEIAFLSEEAHAERHKALMAIRNSEAARIQESPLEMLCDLAASVIPGTAPADALALHAQAVSELKPRLSIFPTMYRHHVVPFFRDYWLARVAEDLQAFNGPETAAVALRAIPNGSDAPRAMLLEVARHLRLP
jgi:hypothetical protein